MSKMSASGTDVLGRRRVKVLQDSLKGKKPNDRPRAIIMAGPQGSGKSTKAKDLLKKERNIVYVNPDSTLMALNGGRKKLPDDQPAVFTESQALTEKILQASIANRFNVCLDTSIPSPAVLKQMKETGYDITFVVMTTPAETARKREVNRDMTQLNWGRPGISSATQTETAAKISRDLPATISRFADSVVTCQNSAAVMSCNDDTRIRPKSQGPDVSVKANQKRVRSILPAPLGFPPRSRR